MQHGHINVKLIEPNDCLMYSTAVYHRTITLRMSKDNTWQTPYRKHRV